MNDLAGYVAAGLLATLVPGALPLLVLRVLRRAAS